MIIIVVGPRVTYIKYVVVRVKRSERVLIADWLGAAAYGVWGPSEPCAFNMLIERIIAPIVSIYI